MAIIQDGTQAFGLSTPTILTDFTVESFSTNLTSNRVDLDDGNGEPLGSKIVPGRVEFSATVQVGSATATPTIGAEFAYSNKTGTATYVIQDVSVDETQADYQRLSISGYKVINSITIPS